MTLTGCTGTRTTDSEYQVAESSFDFLVHPLRLTDRAGEAGQSLIREQLFPKHPCELGPLSDTKSIGSAVEVENVLQQQLGGWQLAEGDKVCYLGEMIHDRKDECLPLRWWQSSDEVQGNVRPRAVRGWELLEQWLEPAAHCYEISSVFVQCQSPEALLEYLLSALNAMVESE